MSALKERKRRDLEIVRDPVKIQHLLSRYAAGSTMFVKGTQPPLKINISECDHENRINVGTIPDSPGMAETLQLYRILGRYIQLECSVVEKNSAGAIKLLVKEIAIAKKERKFLRIPVPNEELHINNIRTSKNIIDMTQINIPASVKVNFSTCENALLSRFDYVKIEPYGKRGTFLDLIRKEGKCLLIEDTQNIESYRPLIPDFFDYSAYLGRDINKKMVEYKQLNILSEIIVPILYLTDDESTYPLGYIQVQSKTERFNIDTVIEVQGKVFEMVDRIRDSNTVFIREKQKVIDFSRDGIKVLINHQGLRDYLLHQRGFTFDLFFRGQAPITIHAMIHTTTLADDGSLTLGLQISGSSARKGEMKRYMDNIIYYEKIHQEKQEKLR